MIRASQKLSKERHTSWTEWVAGMQEKIVEWWQDTMPACIRQEVQNLEAIEGMIHELLQRCGQALVTHWVTAQVADATESHPAACPTCGKPLRCVSRHRSLHTKPAGLASMPGHGLIGCVVPDTADGLPRMRHWSWGRNI